MSRSSGKTIRVYILAFYIIYKEWIKRIELKAGKENKKNK